MPKFTVDPLSITPEYFMENCSRKEIEKLIEVLKEDFENELEEHCHPSPATFLEKCNPWEISETYDMLKNDYSVGKEDDYVRSESQRIFNHHLTYLKENWLAISNEDTEIIAILAKKYGAL